MFHICTRQKHEHASAVSLAPTSPLTSNKLQYSLAMAKSSHRTVKCIIEDVDKGNDEVWNPQSQDCSSSEVFDWMNEKLSGKKKVDYLGDEGAETNLRELSFFLKLECVEASVSKKKKKTSQEWF